MTAAAQSIQTLGGRAGIPGILREDVPSSMEPPKRRGPGQQVPPTVRLACWAGPIHFSFQEAQPVGSNGLVDGCQQRVVLEANLHGMQPTTSHRFVPGTGPAPRA